MSMDFTRAWYCSDCEEVIEQKATHYIPWSNSIQALEAKGWWVYNFLNRSTGAQGIRAVCPKCQGTHDTRKAKREENP